MAAKDERLQVDPVDHNTAMLDERWLAFRKTARRMLFHTGAEDAPFATGGTCFLVTHEDRLFAVTVRHVVGNNLPEKLLLIVSDKTVIPARILEQIDPSDEIGGALDLVIYDLDLRHFNTNQRRSCCAYSLLASGLVHFLGAEAIRQIFDEIRARPRKKLPKRWWGSKTRLRRRPSAHE